MLIPGVVPPAQQQHASRLLCEGALATFCAPGNGAGIISQAGTGVPHGHVGVKQATQLAALLRVTASGGWSSHSHMPLHSTEFLRIASPGDEQIEVIDAEGITTNRKLGSQGPVSWFAPVHVCRCMFAGACFPVLVDWGAVINVCAPTASHSTRTT